MSWINGPLGAFDLETTGVDVETDRVVTACVVRINGREIGPACWIADRGIEIPEAAAAVHGVTTERARAEGRPAAEVLDEVVEALEDIFDVGLPVIGMNLAYDFTLLDRDCRRHGVKT